jgi:hypothetical protein
MVIWPSLKQEKVFSSSNFQRTDWDFCEKNLKGDLNVPDNRMVARQMNPLALVVFGDPK